MPRPKAAPCFFLTALPSAGSAAGTFRLLSWVGHNSWQHQDIREFLCMLTSSIVFSPFDTSWMCEWNLPLNFQANCNNALKVLFGCPVERPSIHQAHWAVHGFGTEEHKQLDWKTYSIQRYSYSLVSLVMGSKTNWHRKIAAIPSGKEAGRISQAQPILSHHASKRCRLWLSVDSTANKGHLRTCHFRAQISQEA